MTAEYIYTTCCVWQCDFGVIHFYLLIFSYLISFLITWFNILCVKSFRLMEQHKQIIGKLTCIERVIFREEEITWNTTLLQIKLASSFELHTRLASKRKESSIKSLLGAPWKRLIKKLWSKEKLKSIKWPGHSLRIRTCSGIN